MWGIEMGPKRGASRVDELLWPQIFDRKYKAKVFGERKEKPPRGATGVNIRETPLGRDYPVRRVTGHCVIPMKAMKKHTLLAGTLAFVLGGALAFAPTVARAQPTPTAPTAPTAPRDLYADTWVATDNLGRSLPVGGEVRAPRAGKTAAMFYYLWQQDGAGPVDISQALAANPGAPKLGGRPSFHWWGQPEAGYFNAADPWVIRRNLSMLSDAGVDVIFFDVTNAFTYLDTVKSLCATALEMRAQGNRTPQIGFLTNARAAKTQAELYREFYAKNLYRELWFNWDGKPLMMGDVNALSDDKAPMDDAVKNFFSWRKSWAWSDPGGWYGDGKGKWPWLDNTPQQPGLAPDGTVEQIVVETAQHPTSNKGKSYRDGHEPPLDEYALTPDTGQGFYFAEQWKRALQVDPPLLFITQWNEWIAQRFIAGQDGNPGFLGRPTKDGDSFFVDAYNAEFNRDIEPMQGGYSDNYYYQLADGLRRYKGARPTPLASGPRTMKLDGDIGAWSAVGPEFRDTIGDTVHRDFRGWNKNTVYKNDSGRNDIVAAKVARDAKNLYFLVQTRDKLTPRTDSNWMMLFLDTDRDPRTGWHGYDARVIGGKIELWQNNAWAGAGTAKMAPGENDLELELPRALISRVSAAELSFDFKWVDNADPNRIESWFVDGDSAPNRRFNYRFLARS